MLNGWRSAGRPRRTADRCAAHKEMGSAEEGKAKGKMTHSSRTKLPKDMPPQLMPFMRLLARLSLRFLLTFSLFGLFMEMGLAPALTKESWRERPKAPSNASAVMVKGVGIDMKPATWLAGRWKCRAVTPLGARGVGLPRRARRGLLRRGRSTE